MEAERELWCAVLHQAISDFVGDIPKDENCEIVQRQARYWFSATHIHPGSFHWICQILGLDEAAVRQGLFQSPLREIISRLKNFHATPYRCPQSDEYPVSPVKTSTVPAKEGELWSK